MARLTLDSPSLRLRIPPRIASYSLCNAAPTYKRDARNTGREWHSHHPPLALALGRDLRSRRPVSARSLGPWSASSTPPTPRHVLLVGRSARTPAPSPGLGALGLSSGGGWSSSPPAAATPLPAALALAARRGPACGSPLSRMDCRSAARPAQGRGRRRRRGTTLEVRVVRGIGSDAHSVEPSKLPAAPLRGPAQSAPLAVTLRILAARARRQLHARSSPPEKGCALLAASHGSRAVPPGASR